MCIVISFKRYLEWEITNEKKKMNNNVSNSGNRCDCIWSCTIQIRQCRQKMCGISLEMKWIVDESKRWLISCRHCLWMQQPIIRNHGNNCPSIFFPSPMKCDTRTLIKVNNIFWKVVSRFVYFGVRWTKSTSANH